MREKNEVKKVEEEEEEEEEEEAAGIMTLGKAGAAHLTTPSFRPPLDNLGRKGSQGGGGKTQGGRKRRKERENE